MTGYLTRELSVRVRWEAGIGDKDVESAPIRIVVFVQPCTCAPKHNYNRSVPEGADNGPGIACHAHTLHHPREAFCLLLWCIFALPS
jgi:hypothetical protein